MKPVEGIKNLWKDQWRQATDQRERAARIDDIRRIMASSNRPPLRPLRDESRGSLLDTYG